MSFSLVIVSLYGFAFKTDLRSSESPSLRIKDCLIETRGGLYWSRPTVRLADDFVVLRAEVMPDGTLGCDDQSFKDETGPF